MNLRELFEEGKVGDIKAWLRCAPEEHGDPLDLIAGALDAFEPAKLRRIAAEVGMACSKKWKVARLTRGIVTHLHHAVG